MLVAYDDGNVRIVSLGLDPRESNLPRTAAFPILIRNAVDWLAPPPASAAADPTAAGLLIPAESDIRPVVSATERPSSRFAVADTTERPGAGVHRAFLLLALLVLAAESLHSHRRRSGEPISPATGSVPRYVRAAVFGLLAASLIGIRLPGGGGDAAVVFAVDLSDSIDDSDKAEAFAFLEQASDAMRRGDRAGLVVFGKDAYLESALGPSLDADDLQTSPIGSATDVGAALRLAAAKLPAGAGGRIVLISDGNENAGDALAAARTMTPRDVAVDVLPLGVPVAIAADEILVEGVSAPRQVRLGEPFEVEVGVRGEFGAAVAVRLYRDDVLVAERQEILRRRGRNTASFAQRLDVPGLHAYTAAISAAVDGIDTNNEGGTVVRAVGRPRVLHVSERPGESVSAGILRAQGFDITVEPAASMPENANALAPWDAVILDNLPAAALGPSQRNALAQYVSALGGGFVMAGGPPSFGPDGYGGSPVEEILPIEIRVPDRVDRPSLATVLVIDKSGSMAVEEQGVAKIDSAVAAVLTLLDVFGAQDQVGVIAFDSAPHALVNLTPVVQRQDFDDLVAGLGAGGGTTIEPAIELAYDWLGAANAEKKHVLLLSDGQTEGEVLEALRRRIAASDVQLSVVGIGDDVDWRVLEGLATTGKGPHLQSRDRLGVAGDLPARSDAHRRPMGARTPVPAAARGCSSHPGGRRYGNDARDAGGTWRRWRRHRPRPSLPPTSATRYWRVGATASAGASRLPRTCHRPGPRDLVEWESFPRLWTQAVQVGRCDACGASPSIRPFP